MKNFLKMSLASFVGVLVAGMAGCFLLFTVSMAIIGSAFSTVETVKVRPNTVFRIMLDKPVAERSKNGQLEWGLSSFSVQNYTGLNDVLKTIDHAAVDPRIRLIYMDLSMLSVEMAHVEEIRAALKRFKASGKPIIAYGDNYSQAAYYLASVADKIYLNPYGNAALVGMRAEVLFYQHLLEKLQIEMQVVRHGKFKSAVEPFIMDKMSPENKEQYRAFIHSIWNHWMTNICADRNINLPSLTALVDNLHLLTAQSAVDNGLVDGLMYKDELLAELCKHADVPAEDQLAMIDVADYAKTPYHPTTGKDRIAVVYADGEITMGKGGDGITSWEFANVLRGIRNDKQVKAVVFRVNSPGGSAQASEIIARELELLKKEKKVVVSMSNYAASGGYWISTPADKIVVNPTSITGSIGVFGIIPNLQKGMTNHLGITTDVAKSNESADFLSSMRPMTARERVVMQESVELIYSQFIDKVAKSRNLTPTQVDEIGQGRVWSGIDAVRLGLADQLGGLNEAIAEAAALAELSNYRTVEYPAAQNQLEQMMKMFLSGSVAVDTAWPVPMQSMEHFLQNVQAPGTYARMPFDVTVY